MANGESQPPGLTFPRDTFAKLTPNAFLEAHLKQKTVTRPNGRRSDEFRNPTVNTSSLTHTNGSAVVRCGDTAVVCGVKAEILPASAIPHTSAQDSENDDLVENLGLLVPNVELSTGCSPAHLPGNPPGTSAQALSYRLLSLLHTSRIIDADDLKIRFTEPKTDEDVPDEGPRITTKAYWTLYIDILCIALDGNAFDTAWMATMAALRDLKLPKAWWDADREIILCSPRYSEASGLRLRSLPATTTFAVFTTASPLKHNDDAKNWVLVDPDAFEEGIANELITVTLDANGENSNRIIRIEKGGGAVVDRKLVAHCVELSKARCKDVLVALGAG